MEIEDAIAQLEIDIKRLKVLYDMFFSGAQQRQPYELRKHVDQMIRQYTNAPIRKYHHRFMLNTLVGRYNTLCELWGKQLRNQEEGGRAAAVSAVLAKAQPTPARRAGQDEEVYYAVNVTDPDAETAAMQSLYERYLEARQDGEKRPQIKLESFVKQITKQAESLKKSSGCQSIEFRILRKGDTVALKARAAK